MLTDRECKAAKGRDKPYKLPDRAGLHLYVTPSGSRYWRYRFERAGKEQVLSCGSYPAVSLADARLKADDARSALRAGLDPRPGRNAAPSGPTFEEMARRWYALNRSGWTERHAADVLGSLETLVFPIIGASSLAIITPSIVLRDVLRPIEARPALETARRVRQRISAVFVFAIASGEADGDPAAIVKPAMAPMKKGRQPAIVELADARTMLAAAEAIPAHPITRLALRFLALTAVRPGELRFARWDEFEGEVWRIPADRMKMKRPHVVPLSPAALEVLAVARDISGKGPMVFPSARFAHRAISENAVGYLLNRAGYAGRHVPHGWRATFSSTMNDLYRADRQVIDLMLAHAPKDRVEASYNRALHMERRRELADAWAALLLEGAKPAATLRSGPQR